MVDVSRTPRDLAPFYDGWALVNDQLATRIASLDPAQLALQPAPALWPIWAIAAHTAGARIYWLCGVFKEPGAERASFVDLNGFGWEDELTHPRQASELVGALDSSWKIVQAALSRWTPSMLQDEFRREIDGSIHTRQSVLMRLITHDSYHCAEISQTLGIHGLEEIDVWSGRARPARE